MCRSRRPGSPDSASSPAISRSDRELRARIAAPGAWTCASCTTPTGTRERALGRARRREPRASLRPAHVGPPLRRPDPLPTPGPARKRRRGDLAVDSRVRNHPTADIDDVTRSWSRRAIRDIGKESRTTTPRHGIFLCTPASSPPRGKLPRGTSRSPGIRVLATRQGRVFDIATPSDRRRRRRRLRPAEDLFPLHCARARRSVPRRKAASDVPGAAASSTAPPHRGERGDDRPKAVRRPVRQRRRYPGLVGPPSDLPAGREAGEHRPLDRT